jgi:PAS domain-containing protein
MISWLKHYLSDMSDNRFRLVIAVLLVIFIIDWILPSEIILLPFYWIPLVLAVSFATAKQELVIGTMTLVLATISGAQWLAVGSLDYWMRLIVLITVMLISIKLAGLNQEKERQIHLSEMHYRLLAQNTSDVVVRLREDMIIWISPSVMPMLGWLPEDCIGRNPSEFIHGDDLPVYAVKLKAISDCKPITPPGWGAMKCWYYSMGYRI